LREEIRGIISTGGKADVAQLASKYNVPMPRAKAILGGMTKAASKPAQSNTPNKTYLNQSAEPVNPVQFLSPEDEAAIAQEVERYRTGVQLPSGMYVPDDIIADIRSGLKGEKLTLFDKWIDLARKRAALQPQGQPGAAGPPLTLEQEIERELDLEDRLVNRYELKEDIKAAREYARIRARQKYGLPVNVPGQVQHSAEVEVLKTELRETKDKLTYTQFVGYIDRKLADVERKIDDAKKSGSGTDLERFVNQWRAFKEVKDEISPTPGSGEDGFSKAFGKSLGTEAGSALGRLAGKIEPLLDQYASQLNVGQPNYHPPPANLPTAQCPSCGFGAPISPSQAGTELTCPKCQTHFTPSGAATQTNPSAVVANPGLKNVVPMTMNQSALAQQQHKEEAEARLEQAKNLQRIRQNPSDYSLTDAQIAAEVEEKLGGDEVHFS